jgi:hypothetical protein
MFIEKSFVYILRMVINEIIFVKFFFFVFISLTRLYRILDYQVISMWTDT